MATKVHMEALSPTMEEGQVVRWLKGEGDPVSRGELLAEIETDKAIMELSARGEGVLRKILKAEGQTAPVGALIAVIGEEGEDISALLAKGGGEPAKAASGGSKQDGSQGAPSPKGKSGTRRRDEGKSQSDQEMAESGGAPTLSAGGVLSATEAATAGALGEPERLKASPLARRLAREGGVELAAIRGSGPGGRIVKRDVEAAAALRTVPAVSDFDVTRLADQPAYEEVPLSQMRKTIARRLTESLGPVPHFFLTVEVDMVRAVQARTRLNALLEDRGEKVSLNDLIIRAVGAALRQHPAVNAAWHGDHIRRHGRVHVGVAVAVEDGLITPVIRDADRKGVAEISREVRELAGRARAKKLRPEEYTGATFSISNLGMFGIHEFTAVINPPESGIVAVGQVEEMPVAVDGQVVVRPRMRLTMSCDHRVVDGATGARFLQTLRAMLEEPAAILLYSRRAPVRPDGVA